MCNGLVPYPSVAVKKPEGGFDCRSTPEERGIQPHTGLPSQGHQNQKVRSPHNIWLPKTARIAPQGGGGLPQSQAFLLRSLPIDSFAHRLICSKLQCRISSSKSARDIWGGAKLTGCRRRAGGQGSGPLSLVTEAWAGAITSLFSPSPSSCRFRWAPNLSSPLTKDLETFGEQNILRVKGILLIIKHKPGLSQANKDRQPPCLSRMIYQQICPEKQRRLKFNQVITWETVANFHEQIRGCEQPFLPL